MGLFPYPNANVDPSGKNLPGATFNYSFPYIQPTSENYGQIRLDENLSNSDTFFARYTHEHAEQVANRSYWYNRDYVSGAMQFATLPPPEKLRQTWAALAPSKHKTHYVTSPHSAKPRRWPPDTCGMAFEMLILGLEFRGFSPLTAQRSGGRSL